MAVELDAWNRPDAWPDLAGPSLDEALDELCARRQTLVLHTPYLAFASRFLSAADGVLKVRATMSRNVAQHTLDRKDLQLRFPWGLTHYGGPTRVLDYLQEEGGKTLLLALPPAFRRAEQRKAYRADHVGRCQGTLGADDGEGGMAFARFNLENISVSGLGVFCTDPLPGRIFAPGHRAVAQFQLERGPSLEAPVHIVHGAGQTLGLAFQPPLDPFDQEALAAWIQPRFQEAHRRWEARAAIRAQAERAAAPKAAPKGVLILGGEGEVAAEVAQALEGLHAVRTVSSVLAPYREALEQAPPLALVVPCAGGLEECHRLRTLLEKCPPRCPVIVLNAGAQRGPVNLFAQEVRAAITADRAGQHPVFFRRIVTGLIRRHWQDLEQP
ncbi:MAG TPA: PilZ domain-containing protein [Holophaga sp.]|nr:PilZ domain-containing protein [Holophaga sp.]